MSFPVPHAAPRALQAGARNACVPQRSVGGGRPRPLGWGVCDCPLASTAAAIICSVAPAFLSASMIAGSVVGSFIGPPHESPRDAPNLPYAPRAQQEAFVVLLDLGLGERVEIGLIDFVEDRPCREQASARSPESDWGKPQ
jgi:hypothetical protein